MLRIHVSHRTELLLDALARALAAERASGSPFLPARVVVPNRNVETYLRLGLAERLGIAANLETSYLRKLLAGLAEEAVPDARVADAPVVEGHLLALLHDERLVARPELAPVRAYLLAAGGEPDAVDRRRCQLAARLARLFDEYAGSRAELLARWRDGGLTAGNGDGSPGEWQRALWLAIFGPRGRLARRAPADGIRWLPLEALWDEAVRVSPSSFAGRTLHVFGLSYIARAYHRMLARLGRDSEVQVYTLNPSRAPMAEPPAPAAHLALTLWGRPGRENLRLLADLEGATVEPDFSEDPATTLLGRLQADIVAGHAPAPTAPGEPDGSLRVLPCPSVRRELEVVAAEIWGLLRRDATLRACDVAVIVPEKSKDLYLAQLPAVFAESCGLPHNLADVSALGGHPVAQAMAALVELPFSAFSRKDILPLLTHPCVLARFPAASPGAWQALASDLGIFRGAGRSDFDPAYLQHDLYSWDQGLARLALGAVADQGPGEADPTFAFGGELYLPGPAIESDDETALGFGLLARALLADARCARGETGPRQRPVGEWLEFVRRMVTAYLVLDDEDGAGQAMVAAFLASLDELAASGLGALPVSYRIAAELARRALGELPWSRGRYLASGVTVASFVPMRALPFRAVFVLGLGADAFPRSHGRSELDLRAGERLPGDVDGREQDLYMFLETLLSTRGHLTLSYVSRDELTGDELPASPVLLELRAVLAEGYLGRESLARLFGDAAAERPPLRRYDDSPARREVLPVAEAEHRARRLGETLSAPGVPASVGRQVAALPPALAVSVRGLLGLPSPSDGGPSAWPALVKIPIAVLRGFLVDPLQASARFGLHMTDDQDDAGADIEDEPFDLERLVLSSILRRTMMEALVAAQAAPAWDAVAAAHRRCRRVAELAGQAPSGIFAKSGAAQQEAILRAWQQGLPALLGAGPVACQRIRFVPNLEAAAEASPAAPPRKDRRAENTAVRQLPLWQGGDADPAAPSGDAAARRSDDGRTYRRAPTFEVRLPSGRGQPEITVGVTLVGDTGLWALGPGRSALSFTVRQNIAPDELGREDLAAFVDYAALAAAGAASTDGFASAVFHAGKDAPGWRARPFRPLTAEVARDYLAHLCTAFLRGANDGSPTPAHPYLLPHEAVLASARKGTRLADEIRRLCAASQRGTGFSSTRGPVPRATEHFAPPPDAEAAAMIAERFGLLLALAREGNP